MKLLFFNRFPIVDDFVAKIIYERAPELTVVRTIPDLITKADSNHFNTLLINVDDRLWETSYISEISRLRKRNIKVIVFGQYEPQSQQLIAAGVRVFLGNDPHEHDFVMALVK